VFSLSLSSLIAGTKYRGEFEDRINQVIEELVSDEDIIVFIDEIHTLVGAGGAEGAIDASNILKPYLARGDIQIIGATTREEYKKFIESDKALDRRFQKISVDEMSISQTRDVLFNIRDLYSKYHNVSVSDEIINKIIDLCDKYVHYGKFPDKAIDIFDEVCAKSSIIEDENDKKLRLYGEELNKIRLKKNELIVDNNFKEASIYRKKELSLEKKYLDLNFDEREKSVLLDTLYDVVYGKTGIPVKSLISFNKEDIINKLNRVVIGQESVIAKMCNIIEKVNKSIKNVPLSLLLVGKSGVGKTFLEREYSKLFYDDKNIIKLDMSEYSDDSSISKILGVNAGYVGYKDLVSLCDKVRRNSYSVLFIDNIEYASKKVIKLFSGILEDGFLIDSSNEKVDFRNTVMFFATNYGCEHSNIGFSTSDVDSLLIKNVLGEEMLSKFSGILSFRDLSREDIVKIIDSKGILSPNIVDKIVEESNYKKFGARKIDYLVSIYKETVEV
jgi:ATP-dependent Clp protease ATP-binding subunit ClpC